MGRKKSPESHAAAEYVLLVAHALMTPLSGIVLWCDMMRMRGELPPAVTKGLMAIDRSARAQAAMLDNLVEHSQREADADALHRSRFDVATSVAEALKRNASAAAQGGIAIQYLPPGSALEIEGDPARLRIALYNVVENAVRASPRGARIDVSVRAARGKVTVTIQDGGAGVAEERLAELFVWRELAVARAGQRHRGLGLGLPVARQIVELHGGTIAADNTPRGLRVTVTLPVTRPRTTRSPGRSSTRRSRPAGT